jgi:hypothetical protein
MIQKVTFWVPGTGTGSGFAKHMQLTQDEQTLYAILNILTDFYVVKFKTVEMSGPPGTTLATTKYWTNSNPTGSTLVRSFHDLYN